VSNACDIAGSAGPGYRESRTTWEETRLQIPRLLDLPILRSSDYPMPPHSNRPGVTEHCSPQRFPSSCQRWMGDAPRNSNGVRR